jgi:hypothetical protein
VRACLRLHGCGGFCKILQMPETRRNRLGRFYTQALEAGLPELSATPYTAPIPWDVAGALPTFTVLGWLELRVFLGLLQSIACANVPVQTVDLVVAS